MSVSGGPGAHNLLCRKGARVIGAHSLVGFRFITGSFANPTRGELASSAWGQKKDETSRLLVQLLGEGQCRWWGEGPGVTCSGSRLVPAAPRCSSTSQALAALPCTSPACGSGRGGSPFPRHAAASRTESRLSVEGSSPSRCPESRRSSGPSGPALPLSVQPGGEGQQPPPANAAGNRGSPRRNAPAFPREPAATNELILVLSRAAVSSL